MKRTITRVFALVFLATGLASTRAALLVYDPFLNGADPSLGQYNLGDLLNQNTTLGPTAFFTTGWTQPGGVAAGVYVTNLSATYNDLHLKQPTGGSLQCVDNQAYARTFASAWDGSNTNTYYMSFLASYGNSGGQAGYRVFEIWSGGTADNNRTLQLGFSQYGNFGAGPNAANFSMTAGGVVTNTSLVLDANNSVNLYVLKFSLSNAQTNDTLSLWVNPDLTSINVEPPPIAVISNIDFAADRLSAITRLGFAPGNPATFDELRVGTVYADVVPPASISSGTWTNQSGGNWSVAANWSGNVVPNGAVDASFGADAFGFTINNPSTVALNIPVTLNNIIFINVANPSAAYTVAGPQALTFDNSAQISAGANTTFHTISAVIANGGSATSITKVGGGTALLTGANTYAVPTVISSGTLAVDSILNGSLASPLGLSASDAANLQLNGGTLKYVGAGSTSDRQFSMTGNGGSLDASGTGALNLNNSGGAVSYTDTSTHILTLTGTNNGANSIALAIGDALATSPTTLTKNGTGKWVLTGLNSYVGPTFINAGTLAVGAAGTIATTNIVVQTNGTLDVSASGTFSLNSSQLLEGYGKVIGPISLAGGSIVLPGVSNVYGTLIFSNSLIPSGGEIAMDLAPAGGGDFITGDNLNFTGSGTLSLTPIPWGLWQTGVRPIMSYSTVSGSPTTLTVNDKLGSRYTFALSASAGQVNLTIGGGAGHNLVWTGAAGTSNWDSSLPDVNWTDTSGPTPSKYFNPDNVTFDGTGIASPVVILNGILFPGSVTASHSSGNYIFTGSGRLSGPGALSKSNGGTLTISNGTNDYAGDTSITGGRITYGVNNVLPFGVGRGNVSVGASGTLDISNMVANINGLSGSGSVSGRATSVLVVGNNSSTSAFSGVISGNLTLVKTNSGTLVLTGLNTYSNITQLRGGVLVANTIADTTGSSIGLSVDTQNGVQMQASTLRYTGLIDATTARGFKNVFGATTNFIDISNSVTLTISGAMSQDAVGVITNAVYKLGPGTLVLAGGLDNSSNSLVVQQGTAILAKTANTAVGGFLLVRNAATAQLGGSTNGVGNQINDTTVVQLDSGSTLDLNGRSENLGGSAANGSQVNGLSGAGTILNSSNNTVSTLSLSNLFITTAVFTGKIQDGLSGGKVALTISNSITLAGSNGYSGDTIIRSGTLTLGVAGALPGGTGFGTLTVSSPGVLNVGGFNITANSLSGSGTINDGSANRTNTVTAITPTGTTNVFSGIMQNSGLNTRLGLLKLGAGRMEMSGANTYSGTTILSNGVLAVTGGGSIGGSLLIDVTSGTTLDSNSATNPIPTFNGTVVLTSGQTLKGNGTVAGNVLSGGGSIIAPGESIGTLTVSGAVTLAGTNFMELDRGAGQNCDRLTAAAIQPFLLGPGAGSTLLVTNTGATLQAGDSFQLFSPSLLNQFKTIVLPPLGSGLVWVNSLTTDGRIRVASSTSPAPVISISWSSANIGFHLQVQTNGFQDPAKWFTVAGSDTTNQMFFQVNQNVGSMFFRLVAP